MVRIFVVLVVVALEFGAFYIKPPEQTVTAVVEIKERHLPRDNSLAGVLAEHKDDIKNASMLYKVDPKIITGILMVESRGNPNAVSPTGAKGCMQTMTSADIDTGTHDLDSFNCPVSIIKGTKYIALLRDRYGFADPFEAVVAYSDGPIQTKGYTEKQLQNNVYLEKVRRVMRKIPPRTFS